MVDIVYIIGENLLNRTQMPIKVLVAEHKESERKLHSHLFYEFVFLNQGFSTHSYNNSTTLLTSGDIFGMRPGDIHGYTRPNNAVLYNCLFYKEVLKNEIEELKKLPGVGLILDNEKPSIWHRTHLKPVARKEVLVCLERMIWEGENKQVGWELKLKSLLIEFLILYSRAYKEQFESEKASEYKYVEYMYKALNYIDKSYMNGILIGDIATLIGLSPDYFSRMFKQFTGLTPMEYIKDVRLAKATESLKESNVSVSQVALEVGFDDPSYFARQFKKLIGVSPSEYQKDIKL